MALIDPRYDRAVGQKRNFQLCATVKIHLRLDAKFDGECVCISQSRVPVAGQSYILSFLAGGTLCVLRLIELDNPGEVA